MIKALDTYTPSYTIAFRDHQPLSRTDFQRHIAALAKQLQHEKATTIVLYCDDTYWFAVALFAAWFAQKTVALLGDEFAAAHIVGRQLTQAQIEELSRSDEPKALSDCDTASSDSAQLSRPTNYPYSGGDFEPLPHADIELNLTKLNNAQLIVYTSGSSGQAKAIPKTLQQLLNEVSALELQFGELAGDAVVLGTVSHQHIYGLLFRVLWPLVQGRAFSATAAFFPETLLAQSQQHAKVLWVSSPAHYKRLDDSHDWAGIAPHITALFSSGGILPVEIAQRICRFSGLAVNEIFGSSETGGVAHRQSGLAPNTAWRALPGVKLHCNEDRALQIQSPHLADRDWYTMDDAVSINADGSFSLLGRLDRVVKIEEKRFSLAAIEHALLGLVDIKEAAVFAETDHERESVAAVLVLHTDAQLQQFGKFRFCAALKRQLAAQLPALAIPRRWRFVSELPMNAQGKISQAALKALFSPAPESSPTRQLPTIITCEQNELSVTYQLQIDADIAYFAGHFPTQPVLPGVAQIHWAVQFARLHWAIPAQFVRMEVIKFQQIIQPENQVTLQLDWDGSKLRFAYTSDSGAHSSGRLLFEAKA